MKIARIFSFIPKKSVQIIDLQSIEKLSDDFATSKIALAEDVFGPDLRGLSCEGRLAKFEEEIQRIRK